METFKDPKGYTVEAHGRCRYVIPRQGGMRTRGVIFSDERLIEAVLRDGCTVQVANVAHLPGIVGDALAMPDIHQGYGFPIGGVAAFDGEAGIVSPGGVGYDINCGVRIYTSGLPREALEGREDLLADTLARAVPSGVGSKRKDMAGPADLLERCLEAGAEAAVEAGFGTPEELDHIEEGGRIAGAARKALSPRALQRGRPQLGTLGSGNHFVEVGVVDRVFQGETADAFGLREGALTVAVHTGSRGLGHQVCDDYIRVLVRSDVMREEGIPDRQLCCARIASGEGRRYLSAMAAAANFAFANRQIIGHFVERAFREVLGRAARERGLSLLYDLAHNIAKFESHEVEGEPRRLLVHRKGATRAFPPGHPDLENPLFQHHGQPVFIPGDMGRYSYVLTGTLEGGAATFGSSAHGAGRLLSRNEAKRTTNPKTVLAELSARGVRVRAASKGTLVEEMPSAYKDVADVISVVERAGLGRPVARIRPLVVVKG